jgi:hypothetical protein
VSLIEKELKRLKDAEEAQMEANVSDIKLLLEKSGQEDLAMMRSLVPNSRAMSQETSLGKKLELDKLDTDYNGGIYTEDMIKELAVDYHLRFLKSHYFIGDMDVEVLAKVRAFCKTTNTSMDEHTLRTQFYILAPRQMFGLDSEKKVYPPRNVDPAIFYRVDDKRYRLIHKWGADFTVLRRIEGWKWKNAHNLRLFNALVHFVILMTLTALFSPMNMIHSWGVISVIVFAVSYFIAFLRNGDITVGDTLTADEDYFSPKNWNSSTYYETTFV